ncbi:MAG: hypothetical protein K8U57_13010 [Planctomycetes bacterium]|nr:hypothetical protein [Planctomycetota bacterium]
MWRARYEVAVRVAEVVRIATRFRAANGTVHERRDFFVRTLGEPFHQFDVAVRHACESWVGFLSGLWEALRVPAMSDEGHADASEALGRVSGFAWVAFAEHLPQREHGLGQPFAKDNAAGFGVQTLKGFACVVAELFEVVAFVAEIACGGVPARPFGAEFRSAGKHGLHFGGDCEHGNTGGNVARKNATELAARCVYLLMRYDWGEVQRALVLSPGWGVGW